MENELMDYTAQANFDFFRYRYMPSEKQKQAFLHDCQCVLKSAEKTVLGLLELGWRLAKLKSSGEWKEVINPETGSSFNYSSFEDFSKYAFGFGKTRTSNLLSMAQFVDYDEKINTIVYKSAEYKAMNTSQLIELAPLPEYQREYFTSKIPVKDMRLCKKYINEGTFSADRRKENFDLLSSAKEWNEKLQKEKDVETARELDEQLRSAPKEEKDDVVFYPTQDEEEPEELEEPAYYQTFDNDEQNSDVGITEERVQYNFSTRSGVRAFLATFEEWDTLPGGKCYSELKRYRFKNGVELFAAKGRASVGVDNGEKPFVLFFLSLGYGFSPIKTSKGRLEIWLKQNENVLL